MFTDSLEGHNLGKYRVLEPLGRGGMARVYRAYHPQLDRYVAIKVLRSDLVEEEEFLARFRREAQAVASLRHPNVVQVFDFDVRGNNYFMVMELLEGDTLRTRLNDFRAREERMPWGETARIILDVLEGLAYAHSEGMIHRDIKPANILLSKRGQAVLTDFGIAQIVGGTRYTVSGALMGTLAYMAPEQGLEGQCDARSDIYSLGIVFYEMLTGEPPFDAETPLAILMKHVNDRLIPPRKTDPGIPKPFERIVLKALSKRPNDRYQSAGEMTEALTLAVKKSKIELPARVSLPLSFTTAEAPSESVAVLSGTAREKVQDVDFASEDTDYSLSQKLAAEAAAQQEADSAQSAAAASAAPVAPSPPPAPEPILKEAKPSPPRASGALFAKVVRPAPREPLREIPEGPAERRIQVAEPARLPERTLAPTSTVRSLTTALLTTIALATVGNLVVVLFAGVTGWWGAFGRGWPFELLLVGLGLLLIMETIGSIWLLIPTGIILGNGFLFAFYAVTDLWNLWGILWPLEPLLIIGTVFATIRLADRPDRGGEIARSLAHKLVRPTAIAIPVVVVLGAIFG